MEKNLSQWREPHLKRKHDYYPATSEMLNNVGLTNRPY